MIIKNTPENPGRLAASKHIAPLHPHKRPDSQNSATDRGHRDLLRSKVPHTLDGHRETESESPLILQSDIGQRETSKL